jgi:long-chain acyl-CoA synthetase
VDGLELQVVGDEGRCRPAGEPGEIRLRGEQVFAGYFEDEAATREKLRDGWLYTGDVGTLDADGHLYVAGRLRTMIKRGGAMIAPRELEEAAERVHGVARAAALGVPRAGAAGGEDVVLVAEVADGLGRPEEEARLVRAVVEHLRQSCRLAPSRVLLVGAGAIPRTANGKVRHEELKRRYTGGELASEGEVSAP